MEFAAAIAEVSAGADTDAAVCTAPARLPVQRVSSPLLEQVARVRRAGRIAVAVTEPRCRFEVLARSSGVGRFHRDRAEFEVRAALDPLRPFAAMARSRSVFASAVRPSAALAAPRR